MVRSPRISPRIKSDLVSGLYPEELWSRWLSQCSAGTNRFKASDFHQIQSQICLATSGSVSTFMVEDHFFSVCNRRSILPTSAFRRLHMTLPRFTFHLFTTSDFSLPACSAVNEPFSVSTTEDPISPEFPWSQLLYLSRSAQKELSRRCNLSRSGALTPLSAFHVNLVGYPYACRFGVDTVVSRSKCFLSLVCDVRWARFWIYIISCFMSALRLKPPMVNLHFPITTLPPPSRHMSKLNDVDNGNLGFCGLGLHHLGPLSISSWPITNSGIISSLRPRFGSLKHSTILSLLLLRCTALIYRGLSSKLVPFGVQEPVDKLHDDLTHLICSSPCYQNSSCRGQERNFQASEYVPNDFVLTSGLLQISSAMERTLWSSPCPVADSMWFASATNVAMDSFLTSRDLLIVTNAKFPDVFAEVSMTHHELVCGMLLCSLCFRVSMDLSLKSSASPIYLLTMFVRLCLFNPFVPMVGNFVLSISLWD